MIFLWQIFKNSNFDKNLSFDFKYLISLVFIGVLEDFSLV